MNKRSVDSYVKFSGYNSLEKQSNSSNYSSNYTDLPSQVPDHNNRFSNPPPQPLNHEDKKENYHRLREIESDKLNQLLSDPNYHNNPKGPTKIFVKVYTNWCGPCKMIAPKIQQLSNDPKYSEILFVQINGEKICEKLKRYINVSAVPIFFSFVAGKQYSDFIVGPDIKKITERLDELSRL
jgi:thioredoxin 1